MLKSKNTPKTQEIVSFAFKSGRFTDFKTVWIVMKEEQEKARKEYAREDAQRQKVAAEELAARRAEIRREISSAS